MELKDIIRDYKNRFHLSNIQLAKRFQVDPNTVARWLRGEVKSLREETAYHMSEVLGYDVLAVLNGKAIPFKRPILGVVKAGYDMFMDENYIGEEDVSLDEFKNGDYYLKVEGNSMINAGIIDGGLVYVKQCQDVHDGDIAVIYYDGEVTVKRFFKTEDGYTLVAENPQVPNKHFTFEEAQKVSLKVIGKVIFCKNYV